MFFKYAILAMSIGALSFMIISAKAQTPDQDRQAVIADQKDLDAAYKQLQKDRLAGNAAGVEIDEDNVFSAQQDFRTDEQRVVEDDQDAIQSDRENLQKLSAQLQGDTKADAAAAADDKRNIAILQSKMQFDKRQMVADDRLEVNKDELAFENENRQLAQDLRDRSNIAGNVDTVEGDKESVKEAGLVLKDAQLKLAADQGN